MKKFTFLLVAVLVWVAAASAQDAQSLLSFNWAHSIDGGTSAGDNIFDMAKSKDGSYFMANSFGTTNQSRGVNFDSEPLVGVDGNAIQGSPYTGTSNNANLLLQKVSNTGSVEWSAYTKKGDISDAFLASTSDGGLIVTLKTRAWVEEAGLDNILEYVDAAGATTTIKDMNTQASEYRFLVLKIDADGKLVWSRLINGLVRTDTKYATKNNAYVYSCVVDDADNIYLAGNYRTELYFKKSDGSKETLVSKNAANWNGDSQGTVGDLFLVKLDKNGYFSKSLLADGTASLAFFDKMAYADGKIYVDGRVQGDGTTMTLGGKAVNASTERQTQILLSVNTEDLSVNYVNALTSVANNSNRFVLQNKAAQYINGDVYFTGLLNGGFRAEGATTDLINSNAAMLKPYVLKVNPATGEASQAAIRTEGGIGGFYGVYEGKDKLYAFGYDMSAGAVLVPINKSDFSLESATVVCKYGTVSVCGTPLADGENLILANRGRVTQSPVFFGTDKSFTNLQNWGVVYYSYKINDTATGINEINSDAQAAKVNVYSTDGIFIKTASSVESAKQGLPRGTYVIGNHKIAID